MYIQSRKTTSLSEFEKLDNLKKDKKCFINITFYWELLFDQTFCKYFNAAIHLFHPRALLKNEIIHIRYFHTISIADVRWAQGLIALSYSRMCYYLIF